MEKSERKILITGANGFIGKALMDYYRSNGVPVAGVDLQGNGADVHVGDTGNPETMAELLKDCEVVIHTAALVSNAMKDEDMWRVNVLGTAKLIQAAEKYQVKRFVQVSSIVAYGNKAVGELDEDHPVHANGGNYVLTKLASEHAVLTAHARGKIEVVVVRPGDVYGPGSRPWIIFPIEAIKKNQFLLPAMGKGFFRPVYIDDLVRGIVLAAKAASANGQIINLACQGYTTTETFFSYHYQWLGKKGPLLVSTPAALLISYVVSKVSALFGKPNEVAPASVLQLSTECWFSVVKAENLLGWVPEVTLEEGMERSRAWAEAQGYL